MIDVSVQPSHIVAGQRARLAIRFTNTSQGPCSDIIFRFELPSGMSLLEGRSKVEIPFIPAGGTYVHEITVEPSKSGEFELTSGNFSYRDQYGVSEYPADFRRKLSVAPGSAARPASPRPAPRLAVRLEDASSKLPTGAWGEIRVLVQNTSDAVLSGVTMDVSGPLRTNGRRSQVPQLRPGATARFTFSVIAEESGQVPVSVRLTFTYPDGLGSIRQAAQEDSLRVVAGQDSAAGQDSVAGSGGTILYLTASPNDPDLELSPLRTDLEMKKVKERLQLSRTRDQYRIEFCPASEWDDLSQALADYDPQVVHFSGHGDSDGNLLLEDAVGGVAPTTPEGLARLFGLHRATITCVIVNACYSERLARAMSQHIDHVVGMRWQIGDEAAIEFSVGFYTGLFAGHSVPEAFQRGLAHIQRSEATMLEYRTPLLLPEP
jgi:CHAT domain